MVYSTGMKTPALLTVALLAALTLTATAEARQQRRSVDPASVASFYAGKPMTVHVLDAQLMTGYGGYTFPGWDRLYVSADVAAHLGETTIAGAIALKILLHESMHQRFGFDEGSTECAAVLAVPDALARFVGVPIGSKLSGDLWKVAVGNSAGMSAEYRDCSRLNTHHA